MRVKRDDTRAVQRGRTVSGAFDRESGKGATSTRWARFCCHDLQTGLSTSSGKDKHMNSIRVIRGGDILSVTIDCHLSGSVTRVALASHWHCTAAHLG